MSSPATSFALNSALDSAALAGRFATAGRVQIDDFLDPVSAAALRVALSDDADWVRVINGGDRVFEIPASQYASLDPAFCSRLDAATNAAAATGFQFRYDSIRIPDDSAVRAASGSVLNGFGSFLSSPPLLSFLGKIIGDSTVAFADGQATRYLSGDFLTRHDDQVAGKHRSAAYVLGLTDAWRPEWGGLLLFLDSNRVVDTFVPRYNCLSLFAVGQPHCVTSVAAYAPVPRIAVTGWLRQKSP